MFENSLYEPYKPEAAIPTPSEEGDLFHGYEVKTWDLGPRIYKILGISAVANIIAVAVFAQGALLTTKGCDSPLVGSVCQVIDTVYVGAMLLGTDREYVDAAYDPTDLGDAEITFVDVSGVTPPLSYPEGYFQVANPVQYQELLAAAQNPTDPGYMAPSVPITTPSTGGSLIDTPQVLPKQNNDVIDGDLPAGFGNSGVTRTPTRKGTRGTRKPPLGEDEDDTANVKPNPQPSVEPEAPVKTDDATADKNGVFINKRPLRLKAEDTIKQVDAKAVKLDAPFSVTIAGTLGLAKDGKTVVLKNPKPIPPQPGQKNDPAMEKLVQDWILAVGDAGWFGYLELLDVSKKFKTKKVLVTLTQNEVDFVATIKAEKPDENNAKTASSTLSAMLVAGRMTLGGDELAFVNSATTTTEGNMLILNVRIPTAQVQEMIQRKLAESNADKKPQNSNSIGNGLSNTAQK